MKTKQQPISAALKMAAFDALLQGPAVFIKFSSSSGVSATDMHKWLEEAAASLTIANARSKKRFLPQGAVLLTQEEIDTLTSGKPPV